MKTRRAPDNEDQKVAHVAYRMDEEHVIRFGAICKIGLVSIDLEG